LQLSLSNGVFANRYLNENIALVNQSGFKNLEFNMKSVEVADDVSVYAAKNLVDCYNLKCLTLHAAVLHVRDEVEIHRAVYYGKISIEFARRLQAPIMVVHSNMSKRLLETQRLMILTRVFEELSEYAKKLKVRLALENLSYASSGYGKNVPELDEVFSIVDKYGEIGFTLDFCHAEATGQTFDLLEKYRDRLCNVHLSNWAHKPFNKESLRLRALLVKLQEYEYDGPLTLELSRKSTIDEIARTKTVLEECIAI